MKTKRQPSQRRPRKERSRITKKQVRQTLLDILCYLVGSTAYALSINIFTAPTHIAPGGLTGVATILNHLIPQIPIGGAILVMNVPLLIASWFKGGRSFTVRTLVCTVWVSLVIDLLEPYVPTFVDESLLVPIFGGVLMGFGLGLLFLRGACTGGSEIVARLLERRMPHIPVGRFILMVDALVVAAAAFVFRDVHSAMYAIILIFVSARVMDSIIYGGDAGKMAMIISSKDDEVAAAILEKMDRGVTKLDSHGAYSGESRHVLLCAVRRSQMYTLRRLVVAIDPAAFIIVTSTDEVFGKGFKSANEQP
jgi:uncharacterized membrane-anchored protein YitT (DUF2179 family)